jgi:TRAP transporter T-component
MTIKRVPYVTLMTLLAALVGWTGCSPRHMVVDEFAAMVRTGMPAIEQEDDLYLLAQAMPSQIKLLETVLVNDPNNRELLVLLARLYGGYAFAILETELEARRLNQPAVVKVGLTDDQLEHSVARYFETGAGYALRALETRHPKARGLLNGLQTADSFISSLGAPDVPALFWYGFNLGGFVQHRLDSAAVMAKAHLVEKAMLRVVALDEAYYHAGAHLVLMVYYGSRPPVLGGSPQEARRHWQRHQQLVPGRMGLRDLYLARYVLVQEHAREAFVRCLTRVARGADQGTDARLLEKVAAERARIYLGAVDSFFD